MLWVTIRQITGLLQEGCQVGTEWDLTACCSCLRVTAVFSCQVETRTWTASSLESAVRNASGIDRVSDELVSAAADGEGSEASGAFADLLQSNASATVCI